MRNANALVIENCTFHDCTISGIPIPDQVIEWFCSCGHRSRAEHEADELPSNSTGDA